MRTKILMSALLALTLMLAACAPATAVPATRVVPTTVIPPTSRPPTAAPTATKAAVSPTKAAATPTVGVPVTGGGTSTPLPANSIFVLDQTIDNDSILIQTVNATQNGWIAIHADQNGQPGEVIGDAAVKAGKTIAIRVKIDPTKVTPKLYAMLHIDAGTIGKFEFPGPDEPVKNGTDVVMVAFNTSLPATSTATPKP